MSTHESSPIALSSEHCSVRFERIDDRYAHRFELQLESRLLLLAADLESSHVDWPSDPPLQSVVLETVSPQGESAILGVGMSGHGHWSLAAQCIRDVKDSANCFEFDYACKIHRAADFLGSTYRLGPVELTQVDFTDRDWVAKIRTDKDRPVGCIKLEVRKGRLDWDATRGRLQILPSEERSKPGTLRWCYRIAWVSCDE